VSNSCGIYEDIKRFLTGNVQKLKFFHTERPILMEVESILQISSEAHQFRFEKNVIKGKKKLKTTSLENQCDVLSKVYLHETLF
jgi:hypothetical protein